MVGRGNRARHRCGGTNLVEIGMLVTADAITEVRPPPERTKTAGEQCAHRPHAYKLDLCHHSWTMSTVLVQIAGLFTLNETWPWWFAVSSTSWPIVARTMVPLL